MACPSLTASNRWHDFINNPSMTLRIAFAAAINALLGAVWLPAAERYTARLENGTLVHGRDVSPWHETWRSPRSAVNLC